MRTAIAHPTPAAGQSPRLQRKCTCGRPVGPDGECAECKKKRLAGILQRQAFGQGKSAQPSTLNSQPSVAPPLVHEVLRSTGQPLDASTRAFMEPRFGHDFSRTPVRTIAPPAGPLAISPATDPTEQDADSRAARVVSAGGQPARSPRHDFSMVRIHHDTRAAASADQVNARAYTVGPDIVFGRGQYAPGSAAGRRLLAHELTHVAQQRAGSAGPVALQRDEFTGGPGKTATDKDRPLVGYAGPMPYTAKPGGTPVPNTQSGSQNCAGDSCSVNKWVNWPDLGVEVPNMTLNGPGIGDWSKATNFVPSGCTRVNCSGIDVNNTRCKESELELITFLYRWPVMLQTKGGAPLAGTQSDFHMIGRDAGSLPRGWHSKMDRREKVTDIRDPWQSLYDSYPHTKQPDRTIQQLCFCCNRGGIATTP